MPKWDIFNALVLLNEQGHPRFLFQNSISHVIKIQWTKFERNSIVSFISKELLQLHCFAMFVLSYFIQVLLSEVSSALQELFTPARQHI